MKKTIKLAEIIILVLFLISTVTACTNPKVMEAEQQQTAGGASSSEPTAESDETDMRTEEIDGELWYHVKTEAQLRAIANNDTTLSQNYMQQADIELTLAWISIGNDEHPFTGKYNGNSYTISGLYYPEDEKEYSGLFGYSKGGEMYNITLVAPDLTNANGTHNGAIVALCLDDGGSHDNTILD